jgi:hypothetical protein
MLSSSSATRLPSGVMATAEGVAGGAAWLLEDATGLASDTVSASLTV